MVCLSLGLKGNMTARQVSDAREHLNAYVAAHADRFQPAGDLRVLGYNSPFLPGPLRYFEVEIPVRERDGKAEQ